MKEKYTHRPQVEYPQEVGTFYPKMLTYNDCKKVHKFIYEMNGRPFYE